MLSVNQFREFAVSVLQSLPMDIDPMVAQGWIENRQALARTLKEALVLPEKKELIAEKQAQPTFLPEGWDLLKSDPACETSFIPKLVEFLEKGESYINGEKMLKRAKQKNICLGHSHAQWLFQHQDQIPKEFRDYHLIFPGTICRDQSGNRRVLCLYWYGGRWCLDFYWLGHGFGGRSRLVSVCK